MAEKLLEGIRCTVLSPNGKTGRWPQGLIFQGSLEKPVTKIIPSSLEDFSALKEKAFSHNENLKRSPSQ